MSFVVFFLIIAVFVGGQAGDRRRRGAGKEPRRSLTAARDPLSATVSAERRRAAGAGPSRLRREKYVGISYQLVLLSDDVPVQDGSQIKGLQIGRAMSRCS
ncbi:MAG: hypothetical protein MZV70_13385 [Desulfobacterales bacterium]|nr:hypothetical protein [Desulfobacterales bacterium]